MLFGDTRDAVDWAVQRGVTKREIVKVLREVIEDVQDDPEIPE
jgi:hypothetical protein